MLKKPQVYKDIIEDFFPRNRKNLSTYKIFNAVKVSHYHETIFKGEKKHGRHIFISDISHGKLKLEFGRFMN